MLARLAALIPPPRSHRVRYFGVLAPHARLRAAVIATAGPSEVLASQLREAAARMELSDELAPPAPKPPPATRDERYTWAMLLARIYDVLPLVCARCGHAMRVLAFVTERASLRRILAHGVSRPRRRRCRPRGHRRRASSRGIRGAAMTSTSGHSTPRSPGKGLRGARGQGRSLRAGGGLSVS